MQEATIHTEKDTLRQVALGDEAAFRRLFHEYWPHIYGVAVVLTKSAILAEDMTQEVFLKIWLKRQDLPAIDRFRDYLFIVARNHIFSELRKHSREQGFTENLIRYFRDQRSDPEMALLQKESIRLIQESIERLPTQQRTVLRMSRDQGLTHEQIAAELGISKNTVRNHMVQALHHIREFLEQNADGLLLYICLFETCLR